MKKLFFPLLLLLFVVSCLPVDHEVEVNVVNNSDGDVSDITFLTTNEKEKVWFDQLRPGDSASVTVEVKNYDADGNYTFEYINSEGKKFETTGNYLEEDFVELHLNFNITNESITVKKRRILNSKI